MNTKKIWVLAIIFGMAMSVIFLILTMDKDNNNQTDNINSTNEVEGQKSIEEEIPVGPALNIESGKRAITIPVNQIQSVSGFVKPGSFVDVISIRPFPLTENSTSQIVLENIRVLAVGRTIEIVEGEENQEPYQMVTLEVTPAQGAALAMANEAGILTLLLRGEEAEIT